MGLDGYFRKPNGPAGKKYPVVIPFQGADTMAEATILGGEAYTARGMAYLAVDFPGQDFDLAAAIRIAGRVQPPGAVVAVGLPATLGCRSLLLA